MIIIVCDDLDHGVGDREDFDNLGDVLGVEPPREIGVSLCQSYSPTQALMHSQEMMMIKH